MPTFATVNRERRFSHGRCSNVAGIQRGKSCGHNNGVSTTPAHHKVERGDEQFGLRPCCSFFHPIPRQKLKKKYIENLLKIRHTSCPIHFQWVAYSAALKLYTGLMTFTTDTVSLILRIISSFGLYTIGDSSLVSSFTHSV